MDIELFLLAALALVALIVLFKTIRIVPQGNLWIIERLGRYQRTLEPGLSFLTPFVDRVAYRVSTKDALLTIPTQEVITRDNALILINALAFIRVTDARKACYSVDNYRIAIENLVTTNLRAIVGKMTLDESLSSREMIKGRLVEQMESDLSEWGVSLRTAELQDINPGKNMQDAMERQAASERLRRATETEAMGKKNAAILEAEGRKDSAFHDATGQKNAAILTAEAHQKAAEFEAEAQLCMARATAESIRNIGQAIQETPEAVTYLLGDRQIEAMGKLATSENAKTIMMPLELSESLRAFTTAGNVMDGMKERTKN